MRADQSIKVRESVYGRVRRLKNDDETFSECITRACDALENQTLTGTVRVNGATAQFTATARGGE